MICNLISFGTMCKRTRKKKYKSFTLNSSGYFLVIFMTLVVVSCAKAPQVVHEVPQVPEVVIPQPPELSPFEQWQKLVMENRYASLQTKLVNVNEFFNHFDSVDDRYLWGRNDYWATLSETLDKSGGDCEDFSIAKYFTLRDLDIPEDNMRITYVISMKTEQPHMVLTYRLNSSEEPIVLDSMNNYLLPVSKRPDLVPVYGFNRTGYWVVRKDDGWEGEFLGNPSKLSLWQSVLQRMMQGEAELPGG